LYSAVALHRPVSAGGARRGDHQLPEVAVEAELIKEQELPQEELCHLAPPHLLLPPARPQN